MVIPECPDRFVACLDILGFKKALECRGTVQVAHSLASASYIVQILHGRDVKLSQQDARDFGPLLMHALKDLPFPGVQHLISFSDSIILFTEDDRQESLVSLCEFSNLIFQLFLLHKLPLRGAIAKGSAIINRDLDLYVGTAIVEAHLLEQSLDLVGIVLHPTLQCDSASPANITKKTGEQQLMLVPRCRDSLKMPIRMDDLFHDVRCLAGPDHATRYANSEHVVAAMMNMDAEQFRPR